MKAYKIQYYLTVITLWFSVGLSAQEYKLQGEILTAGSKPVEGAVILLQIGDSLVGTALTKEKGHFEFQDLPTADYKITISSFNYEPLEENVALNEDRKVIYTLYPIKQINLEEVEIVSDRSKVAKQLANGTAFYLSKAARNSNNPYNALREIPKLVVNESDKKLLMNDGSRPLLLINGVQKEGGLDIVDPQDIESVEIIDFPSARYLSDGVTSVVNIKLKRKRDTYQKFNVGTRHSFPVDYGITNGYYEMGNAKYSIYAKASHLYFTKDKVSLSSEQKNDSNRKYLNRTGDYDLQVFDNSLGGDYVFSDKDYLSYSITYNTYFSKNKSVGTGEKVRLGTKFPFDVWQDSRTKYYINTYNLYHKHSFGKEQVLETTVRFNLNGHKNSGDRKEVYNDLPDYYYLFDYDNYRRSFSLELNYSTIWKEQSFNLGSRIHYKSDRIRQKEYPAFHYKEWDEYVYGDIAGQPGERFSYLASLGMDMIFNQSQHVHNHYIRLKSTLSLNYSINSSQAVKFAYRLDNEVPDIKSLNPYNTSADSLYRTEGNPLLLPNLRNRFSLEYSFNKNGIYLAPGVSYMLVKNNIVQSGNMDNNVYVQTYVNEGRYKELDGNLTFRYSNDKWGNLGGTLGYTHSSFTKVNKGSVYVNCDFSFYYKNVWMVASAWFQKYYYTPVSITRNYVPDSDILFGWQVNSKLTLNVGMRYFLGGLKVENRVDDGGYYSRYVQTNSDRRYLFNIGFTYYWKNKTKSSQRNKKQLYKQERGISL